MDCERGWKIFYGELQDDVVMASKGSIPELLDCSSLNASHRFAPGPRIASGSRCLWMATRPLNSCSY